MKEPKKRSTMKATAKKERKPINSRAKGKAGELELSHKLREIGIDARRGVQYAGGADSPDVVGLPGIHIEVKRVENLNLLEAFRQSERDSAETEVPSVFHRKNRTPWLVTIPLDRVTEFCCLWLRAAQRGDDSDD